jgi:hypothetical protein
MTMRLFPEVSPGSLGCFDRCSRRCELSSRVLLFGRVNRKGRLRERHFGLELRPVRYGPLEIIRNFSNRRISLAPLLFGTFAAGAGVTLTLFGYRDFRPQLLSARGLLCDEASELVAPRLSGCSRSMRGIAGGFRRRHCLFGRRYGNPQLAHAFLEARELIAPRVHLARGESDLDGEASPRELAVTLSAFALPGQRPDLRLNFRDKIVDA